MGMSASQGRFLLLTAQKSNNEYQAQCITFERSMLASNVERWTAEYNEATQNEILLYGQVNSNNINLIMKDIYKNWDENLFFKYLEKFNLPKDKIIKEY